MRLTSRVIVIARCVFYGLQTGASRESTKEQVMSNPVTGDPAAVAAAYIETWNETDRERRMAHLRRTWAADARYVDPMMAGTGLDQISELIGAVHSRFPEFRFALLGNADGYADHVRFSWALGPQGKAAQEAPIKGSDVVELKAGRLQTVIGFLDQVPAA
jgi:hypothetical protein